MKLPIKTCSIEENLLILEFVCVWMITGNKCLCLKKKGKLEYERSLSLRTQMSL